MSNNSPRKVVKAKRVLPSAAEENQRAKSVTFSSDTVETSIGGTQRVGKIKHDLLLHFDTPVIPGTPTRATSRNSGTVTPKSNGSARSSVDKENNDMKSLKQATANSEAMLKDSSTQSLTVNRNNSSSKFRGSVSPMKDKLSTTSASQSKKTQNKKALDNQNDVSLRNRKGLDNSQTKPDEKNEEQSFIKPSQSFSEDQKTISASIIPDSQSTRTENKKDSQNDVSLNRSKVLENSQIKPDERSEEHSFVKPPLPVSEDRRTTAERIETVTRSPFRTPDAKYARRHTLESKLFGTPDCYRDVSFGTPRLVLSTVHDESVDLTEGEDSCSITVAVRVRPFGQRELADSNTRCCVVMCGNETTLSSDNGSVHRFAYDFSFWSHDKNSVDFCDQENVYARLAQPLLGKAFEGYNTCLFAYGQTGSGKSYSIMGNTNDPGIVPRFCAELFNRADNLATKKKVKVNVEISFFEIYNEKIHDLLAGNKDKGAKKTVLKVREHPILGPYVEGLSTYVVNSFDDVEGWITLGNKNRATAATGMNDKSSRSHSVFTIVLTQTRTENIDGHEHDHSVNSKINLVDLAGSERQSMANTTGERLREGANINKSLLTLGKVIALLSERSVSSKKRKIFIPYRDSVLTWLLKESLGGNSKTAMIATISPSNHHSEETLSTLRYAQQARSIVNVVRINEDPKAKIIRQLRAEIERLRGEQGGLMNEEALAVSMCEIARLKSEMEELGKSWQERLRQAEARKAEELQLLERSGITLKVNHRLPSLVNLNEDPQLSEMLLYVIKEGETKVGREIDESQQDIKLTGALIADSHCVIHNKAGIVKITPLGDAPTYINGNLIIQTTTLHHGDRVILGGDHYFRFSHPVEVQNKNDVRGSSEIKDFDFAKQELHRVQEARLQAELEEELEKTRKELSQQKDGYENKLKGLESILTQVEETHREAQTTISSLKKQNMMLEKEVLAGRTRQKMDFVVSKKIVDEAITTKSKIVPLLEAETKNTADRLDKLRKKRRDLLTPAKIVGTADVAAISPGSRRDLYKIALLLREANKINQSLKTHLTFSREDVLETDGGDTFRTQIRVTNNRHRMFTLWSVARFEDKLAQMRDLYQNGSDISVDDDEVFNDTDDVWEKEASVSSPAYGQIRSWKSTPKTAIMTRTVASLRKAPNGSSPRCSQDVDVSMVRACKSLLSGVGDSLSALHLEESMVDKVLHVCQRIRDNSTTIVNSDNLSSFSHADNTWSQPMLHLAADVHLLASLTTLWSSVCHELQSMFLRDLLSKSTDQVKTIAHQTSSLCQGCEAQLGSLVCESVDKLSSAVLSLCETCGQLSLALDLSVLRLEQAAMGSSGSQLSSSVCQSFLAGCNSFVTSTLEGSVTSIENSEGQCLRWRHNKDVSATCSDMSKRLSHVLSCLQALLSKTLQVQRDLNQETNTSNTMSAQYCASTYKRLQGVVASVSAIVDACTLLVQCAEPIVLGTSQDIKRLERCADLLQKSLQRLLSASSYSYTPSSTLSLSSPALNHHSREVPSSSSVSPSSSSAALNHHSKEVSGSSSSSSSSSTASRDLVSSSSLSSVSSQSEASTSVTVSSNSTASSTESDMTEVTLLSESQLGQIDSSIQEVSMALSLFIEYIQKMVSTNLETDVAMTPRGRQILPASPEKLVLTPAMNAARLKRMNIQRTVLLASRDENSS
ncbi:hypothetical protein BsWGS_23609 [Bradybaena similaris]